MTWGLTTSLENWGHLQMIFILKDLMVCSKDKILKKQRSVILKLIYLNSGVEGD